jgi:hypothetical protein
MKLLWVAVVELLKSSLLLLLIMVVRAVAEEVIIKLQVQEHLVKVPTVESEVEPGAAVAAAVRL